MHIPKTAGTTLREIIDRQYKKREIYTIYPGLASQYEELNNYQGKEDLKLVMGHFYFGIHEYFAGPSAYCTFLRDPVEQAISHIRHLLNSTVPLHQEITANYKTLEELTSFKWFCNLLTSYISGKRHDDLDRNQSDCLELAKHNLNEYFSHVCITERFNESILLMKNYFGWKNIYYQKLNTSKEFSKIEPDFSEKIIDRIRNNNQLDLELYQFATQLFDRQIQEIPNFEKKLKKFNKKNHSRLK